MLSRLRLIGWLLFLLSSIFFLSAAVRDGDMLMVTGSIFFLVAVIVFLVLPDR